VEAMINVEHLGIDFGLRKGAVCTSCGDEYISEQAIPDSPHTPPPSFLCPPHYAQKK